MGLVENYGDSRPQPAASEPLLPSDASDSIYSRMLATEDVSDQLVDNIESKNDQPPMIRMRILVGLP